MPHRPAQVWTGSTWDDIGDSRLITHNHGGGANGANIPQSSVTNLTADLGSKLNIAGGKILQIVRATDTTDRSTTSTSFVDVTGMSVTITPEKNNSSVLIVAVFEARTNATGATGSGHLATYRITDASNNPISGAEDIIAGQVNYSFSGTGTLRFPFSLFAYATPATINAVTYKLRFLSNSATTETAAVNGSTTGQMYAIEVSA